MNETNNSNINNLISELENSIRVVNRFYGEIEYDGGTAGQFLFIRDNSISQQDLIQKSKSIIEFLTNINKQLDLEPIVPELPWKFKLKNNFNFIKEIFFCVTGIEMWISAFKEIKTKWKEPAYGSITLAIFKSLAALFIPAVFVGLVLSIIHVIIPVIVITSLLAPLLSILIYQYADDKIEGTHECSNLIRKIDQKNQQIQRRNEIRKKHQEEIAKFKSLCQKYINEYAPPNFNKLNSVDNKQNLGIQTIPTENKNKDDIIKETSEQDLKKEQNKKDNNKERPKLASLHDSTIDKKTHASGEKNDEPQ